MTIHYTTHNSISKTAGEADLRPQHQRAKNVRAKTLSYRYTLERALFKEHYAIHSHIFSRLFYPSAYLFTPDTYVSESGIKFF